MGRGSVSSKFLVILNVIYTILGVGIIGFSTYFFLGLLNLINLRNENNFQLEMKIYWIEVLPCIFAAAGLLVVLVSCCAFLGVIIKSRPLVLTNVAFQILTILLLAGAATVSLKYAYTEETDHFINIIITDGFTYQRENTVDNTDKTKVKAFEAMEIDLRCCGLDGPSSYNGYNGLWQTEYPVSCCKNYKDDPVSSCPKTNKIVHTRKGCYDVAVHHVRIAVIIFAAAGILTAFIGLLNLVCALLLTNGLSNRKALKAKLERPGKIDTHRSHVSNSEMETLKMGIKV